MTIDPYEVSDDSVANAARYRALDFTSTSTSHFLNKRRFNDAIFQPPATTFCACQGCDRRSSPGTPEIVAADRSFFVAAYESDLSTRNRCCRPVQKALLRPNMLQKRPVLLQQRFLAEKPPFTTEKRCYRPWGQNRSLFGTKTPPTPTRIKFPPKLDACSGWV